MILVHPKVYKRYREILASNPQMQWPEALAQAEAEIYPELYPDAKTDADSG